MGVLSWNVLPRGLSNIGKRINKEQIFIQILGTNMLCIYDVGVLSRIVWPRGLTNIGKRINKIFEEQIFVQILCSLHCRNKQVVHS